MALSLTKRRTLKSIRKTERMKEMNSRSTQRQEREKERDREREREREREKGLGKEI